jgi:hypothetical protein
LEKKIVIKKSREERDTSVCTFLEMMQADDLPAHFFFFFAQREKGNSSKPANTRVNEGKETSTEDGRAEREPSWSAAPVPRIPAVLRSAKTIGEWMEGGEGA